MHYLSFTIEGRQSWGVGQGDRVWDLGARGVAGNFLQHLQAGGRAPVLPTQGDLTLGDVRLQLPLRGSRLFCTGLNYRAHVTEADRLSGDRPTVFIRTWESMVPAGAALWRPLASHHFDYEGELACVIGKGGRHIAESDALDHVFGYSIVNDGSVRDFQEQSVTVGKNFEASGAFGPWIVDAEEAPAWDATTLTTRLNGETVQQTATNMMIFSLPTIIAYLSEITTLHPGDIIATGTPSGVGALRTPPLWMRPGDRIEIEIGGIGVLSNPVIAEPG